MTVQNKNIVLVMGRPNTGKSSSLRNLPQSSMAYLNCDLKARMDAGEPVRTPQAMQSKLLGHLRSLQKQPERIRSYFKHEKIRYAA